MKIVKIYTRSDIENNPLIIRALFKYPRPIACASNESIEELHLKTVLFKELYPNVLQIYEVTYVDEKINNTKSPDDKKDEKGILRNPNYIFDTDKEKLTPRDIGIVVGGRKTRTRNTRRKRKLRKSKRRKQIRKQTR